MTMLTHRTLWVSGAAVAGLGAWAAFGEFPPRTKASKSIENRYSAGGGGKGHLPGAGTKLGDSEQVTGRDITGGRQGAGSETFVEMRKEQDQGPQVVRKENK